MNRNEPARRVNQTAVGKVRIFEGKILMRVELERNQMMKKVKKGNQREILLENIDKAVAWKDYKFALHLAEQLLEMDPGDIAAYLARAKIYSKQGDYEETKVNLQHALKLAKEAWAKNEIEHEYRFIEEIESVLDGLLDKKEAEKRRLARFTEYAYGLLYFIGAAKFSDLKRLVEEITDLSVEFTQSDFAAAVEQDNRFKVVGVRPMFVSLSEVKEPKKLVREFDESGIEYGEFSIDDLVDSRGVWAELFFDRPEMEALETLRKLTGDDFIVEKLHMLFNQEEFNLEAVVARLFETSQIPKNLEQLKVIDLIIRLYNDWPRWDLGGNTPVDLSEMISEDDWDDEEDDDWEDVPQQPIRVVKIGRNEPCLCGSGKKYKKCCGKEI